MSAGLSERPGTSTTVGATSPRSTRRPVLRTDARARPGGPSRLSALLARPLATYHLLLACTLMLLLLGLVMVFSASSVRSLASSESVFTIGMKHAQFIAIGLPLLFLASRTPVRLYRLAAYPLLGLSLLLLVLVLVPAIGNQVNGARSWIPLPGSFNLQPSELAKLALVLWGADLLARKQRLLGEYRHLLVPLLPVAGLVLLLVMGQPDLGTGLVLGSLVMALLWVVGTPFRLFAGLAVTGLLAVSLYAVNSTHGMRRLTSFRDPFADPGYTGYQAVQGFYALSSGGWSGLGLGASREKWSGGLPAAHTDYVFAIIGEELGLLGTLTVLVLFTVLIAAGMRVAQRADDPFVRLAAAGATAWLAAQAIINMGAVVGLLPITGIPLPLVSFGGSAMLVTLVAIGMLLSFARAEPDARVALRARPPLLDRLPGAGEVLAPRQRTTGRARAGRRTADDRGTGSRAGRTTRARTARAGQPVPARSRPAGPRSSATRTSSAASVPLRPVRRC